jgi:hypothetical protein
MVNKNGHIIMDKTQQQLKADKRAAALRENLKKRKAAAKSQKTEQDTKDAPSRKSE